MRAENARLNNTHPWNGAGGKGPLSIADSAVGARLHPLVSTSGDQLPPRN